MNKPSSAQDRSLLSNILHFSSSNLYRHVLGFITSLFRPALLGPELYGIWSLLNVLPYYATHLHLGSRNAMRYQLPALYAQQQQQYIFTLRRVTFTGTFILNLIAAVAMIVYAQWADFSAQSMATQVGLWIMAIIIVCHCVYEHVIDELKGQQNFMLVSHSNYVRFTLNFVLTLVLVFHWGLYGALLALLGSILLSLLFLARYHAFHLYWQFDLTLFWQQIRFGFPIVALDLVTVVLRSLDKLFIAAFLGLPALGLYAIATMFLGPMMNIPGASREVVEQDMMANQHKYSAQDLLDVYCLRAMRFTAYSMPVMILSICSLLPLLIHCFMDKFQAAILPTQVLLIGSYFLALGYPCRGIIVANRWQTHAALYALLAIVFHIVLTSVLLMFGFDIAGVAFASSASFLVLSLILLRFILQRLGLSFFVIKSALIELILPFIYMLLLFVLVSHVSWLRDMPFWLSTCIMWLLLMLFYGPVLLLAWRYKRIHFGVK